jgi:hypothetical protein
MTIVNKQTNKQTQKNESKKERLNSDGQQNNQYQQNKQSLLISNYKRP